MEFQYSVWSFWVLHYSFGTGLDIKINLFTIVVFAIDKNIPLGNVLLVFILLLLSEYRSSWFTVT